MKNKKKMIIPIIIVILAGIFLTIFYKGNFKPSENNETNNSAARLLSSDKITIEAIVLNVSHGMILMNSNGSNGQLNGGFAKIIVDKIIDHTRFDPGNELGFNPLVVGDIVWIGPFEDNSSFISKKFIVSLEKEYDYWGWFVKEDNKAFWNVKEYNILE